ncbi:MAG: PLP-dependent aminotransferase family protein [Methanomicrobiales archaeon]|nr:PLP-dependent aminotransferase family protein [Methanomicrobiales archaeon]
MAYRFSRRIVSTPKSFIRETLKATQAADIISFAGGLPNPECIDTAGIGRAAADVIREDGKRALQYATTEGHEPLREYIAERYRRRYGLDAQPDEILITNGSQQCLDLIGKVLIDAGDAVAIERPGYLGAIQAFSLYEPVFQPVPLAPDGPDTGVLEETLRTHEPAFFYGIPNAQNPSGITYSDRRRRECAKILAEYETVFVEDDAYGELRFDGKAMVPVARHLPGLGVMTGSFSKIFSPGMRLGWIYAPADLYEKLVIAKQASDLHSNYLSQRILSRYLEANDIDAHIATIRDAYRMRAQVMVQSMEELFPDGVAFTRPEGGMFVWVTFPEGISSLELFERALAHRVVMLPGVPFYTDGGGESTGRFNFTNADPETIRKGIGIIGDLLREMRG